MIKGLLLFYVLFVVARDGQRVAYNLWAFYNDHIKRPYYLRYKRRAIQYASNSIPPFEWLKR